MPSKTQDIEFAIELVLKTSGGPIVEKDMHAELLRSYPVLQDEDPRWIAAALMHLRRGGRIVYPDCDPDHHHDYETCTLTVTNQDPTS